MKLATAIAKQIRYWRDEGGWNQSSLCRAAKMKQSSLSRIESGRHLATLRSLQQVARPMNADIVVRLVRRDRSPFNESLVDRVAAAMVDCHPDSGRSRVWKDWLAACDGDTYDAEFAREWVAARRNEAKAAIEELGCCNGQSTELK